MCILSAMETTLVPDYILRDLQWDSIDVQLFQRGILSKSDFVLVKTYSTNSDQINIMFEILRSGTKEQHDSFLEVIQVDYPWLRDKCEILLQKMRLENLGKNVKSSKPSLGNSTQAPDDKENKMMMNDVPVGSTKTPTGKSSPDSTVICMEYEKLNQTVTPEMMSVVRRNARVVRGWTTLAHVLGLSCIVHNVRMRMIFGGEDVDACVLHLLQEWQGRDPKNATLHKLLLALREEAYNDVADELEQKFVIC